MLLQRSFLVLRIRALLARAGASAQRYMSSGLRDPQPGFRVQRQVHDARVQFPEFLKQPKIAAVIGAPMTLGQPKEGTDNGPEMIRKSGLHAGSLTFIAFAR